MNFLFSQAFWMIFIVCVSMFWGGFFLGRIYQMAKTYKP